MLIGEKKKKHIRMQNQAEQVYQGFLVKGRGVALKAREAFIKGGRKKVRKFVASLHK